MQRLEAQLASQTDKAAAAAAQAAEGAAAAAAEMRRVREEAEARVEAALRQAEAALAENVEQSAR